MATKATAKMGLAMHIGTSKHYARVIYRLAKRLKRLDKHDDKALEKLEEAIEDKSIKEVMKHAKEFMEIEEKEEEYEGTIEKDGFILEYRIAKDVKELIEDIEKAHEKSDNDEITNALKEIKDLFKEIYSYVKKEVKRERDVKKGYHRIREMDARGENWLERILKRDARHLKRDTNPTKRHLKSLEKLLEDIIKGKAVDKSAVKELHKGIKEVKKDIKEEFEEIYDLQKLMVKLAEKHKKVMKRFEEDLNKLKSSGFPEDKEKELEDELAKLEAMKKHLEKDNLITAKAIRQKIRSAV